MTELLSVVLILSLTVNGVLGWMLWQEGKRLVSVSIGWRRETSAKHRLNRGLEMSAMKEMSQKELEEELKCVSSRMNRWEKNSHELETLINQKKKEMEGVRSCVA